jgi:sigma-E factor negative regulatory protein RseA
MSQILDEQLSAFLDGELPAEELDLLLARLDQDEAHRVRLGRYALIGECLRTGSARPEAVGLCERVRSVLGPDTAPLAAIAAPRARLRRGRVAGGIAAAAAVVAVLVAGPAAWRGDRQPAPRAAVPAAPTADSAIGLVKADLSRRLDPRSAARLTGYLVAHGEYANQLSRSTLDSHLVTARAERASWRQAQDPADVR